MSERTVARRLQAHGTSLTGLLDQARRQAALAAVAQGGQTFGEISRTLGFADPSTFQRAFRRWTGGTPGAWRRRHG